ncbi:uncharacterized protein LOC117235042 isoform X1 [Bombus vosnesenskii]|uniref:Uncharacterized protein LOC117235042 isoform X1 n=1 Tax=Bombus vosnesenskii TaxID=207650 RepID=A0A6J3KL81_9HYME|nr:uncharacterized protein LOC117235042 isoform X1 [Bombus vosnesenskii]XP_033352596.1 uncharacterized protein LOC117235042 isoform X1 [Bombus vosnesenskii]
MARGREIGVNSLRRRRVVLEEEVDGSPRCNTTRSTPPQTYGPHCVPLGAGTPWRFHRSRGDTSRDTAAFIERTPCFFSEKLRIRGSLKTVGLLASCRGKARWKRGGESESGRYVCGVCDSTRKVECREFREYAPTE